MRIFCSYVKRHIEITNCRTSNHVYNADNENDDNENNGDNFGKDSSFAIQYEKLLDAEFL